MRLFPALCCGLIFFSSICQGQVADKTGFAGDWTGKLVALRLSFRLKAASADGFSGVMDSPDQHAFDIPCDSVLIEDTEIRIVINAAHLTYKARLINDSTLEGRLIQGVSMPLTLHRTSNAPVEIRRPQTPVAPFPYTAEEVTYTGKDKKIRYAGTLTIPPGKGPFAAVVLITGSGPQNRDEELMGHKLFAVLADALTRNGIMVLRVDDRGVGQTSGSFTDATSADFAADAGVSFDYLLHRPETDRRRAGLIGHSEGGMIAPMVAAARKDVKFIILLAGPGIPIPDLMAEQNAAIMRSAGMPEAAIMAYQPLYRGIMKDIIQDTDRYIIAQHANHTLAEWKKITDPSLIKALGLADSATLEQTKTTLVRELSGKWFRYFLNFDPAVYLQQVHCKVLALNGSKDIQVIAASNLAGIEKALKKNAAGLYTIEELPGKNHLFQTCNDCTTAEYGELDETFSPEALKLINDWLDKEIKK